MLIESSVTRLAVAAVFLLTGTFAAQAQQVARMYRVGLVSSSPGPASAPISGALRQGLRELGYVEGNNVIVEERFTQGRPERIPDVIAELIGLKVDVLVVGSTVSALEAKKATTTVPIVFAYLVDPVATGIVSSLARPGGNITGVTAWIGGTGFAGKWMELLKEAVPDVSHVAVLSNSANPACAPVVREVEAAARTLKVKLDVLDAANATNRTSYLQPSARAALTGLLWRATRSLFLIAPSSFNSPRASACPQCTSASCSSMQEG
jgi:putative ABC transport system substrate-binding protein